MTLVGLYKKHSKQVQIAQNHNCCVVGQTLRMTFVKRSNVVNVDEWLKDRRMECIDPPEKHHH